MRFSTCTDWQRKYKSINKRKGHANLWSFIKNKYKFGNQLFYKTGFRATETAWFLWQCRSKARFSHCWLEFYGCLVRYLFGCASEFSGFSSINTWSFFSLSFYLYLVQLSQIHTHSYFHYTLFHSFVLPSIYVYNTCG